jgi:uncharacterized protein (DUF362 family)
LKGDDLKPSISLVKSKDHYYGVHDSLKPLKRDVTESLSNISSLVIKINLVITRIPRYSKGVELATTPVDAVRSFIDFIAPFYKGKIIIAEEAAWGDTMEGFTMYGFTELAEENTQVELLDLKSDEALLKKIKYSEGELELPLSRTILEAPFLVSIARPKTHCNVVMTASIKNVLVGAIQKYSMRRKIRRGKFIHSIMASIADFTYPDFVIVDGTVGMEGGGPVRGTEIKAGWTLASFDALATDSLATCLMGFSIDAVEYLDILRGKKFGALYPRDKVEIIGEKVETLITPFKPHRSFKNLRNVSRVDSISRFTDDL